MITILNATVGNVDNDCQFGGVAKIWAVGRELVTVTTDAANSTVITAIVAAIGVKDYQIVIRPDSGDANGEFTKDGSDVFYKQTVNFTVAGNDPITALAQKQLDLNPYLFIMQRESGELIVAGAGASGMKSVKSTLGAKSGANGTVFNFEGKAKAPLHSVAQTVLDSLLD